MVVRGDFESGPTAAEAAAARGGVSDTGHEKGTREGGYGDEVLGGDDRVRWDKGGREVNTVMVK